MNTGRAALGVVMGITAALAGAEPTARPAKVDLRTRSRPDHVTQYRIVSKTVGSIRIFEPMPEMKFSQSFEQEMTNRCRILKPDGSAVVDTTLDRMAMKMSMMGMNIEYDSRTFDPAQTDREELRIIGRMFSAMVGAKFTTHMGADGQPTKVEGLGEVMKKAFSNLGDEKMPDSIRKMFDQFGTMFGDENMAEQMKSLCRMTPTKGPVGVGDTWEQAWAVKLPMFSGNIQGKGQYELAGFEDLGGRRCAKIRVKETFSMASQPKEAESPSPPGAASAPARGILERLQFDMSSSGGEGIAYWDYEQGELVQLRQTQRMTIQMNLAADENAAEPEMKQGFRGMTQKLNTAVSVDLMQDGEPVASRPVDR